MALPIPQGQNRTPKPAVTEEESKETGLPTLPPLPPRPTAAKPAPAPAVEAPRPSQQPRRAPSRRAPAPEPELEEGWAIDEETGLKYRVLPKSEYDAQGNPVLQVPDFDADDLNAEANNFLAHLRVAPTKEEMRQLREERARKMRARQAAASDS